MKLQPYLDKIAKKENELSDAKKLFLDELKKECDRILEKRIYNRKYKKCLVYVLFQVFKGIKKKDVMYVVGVNQSAIVKAMYDVEYWINITECKTIKLYISEIRCELLI